MFVVHRSEEVTTLATDLFSGIDTLKVSRHISQHFHLRKKISLSD